MYLCNLVLVAIYIFTIHIQLAVDEDIFIILKRPEWLGIDITRLSFTLAKKVTVVIPYSISIYSRNNNCHFFG